MKLTNRHKTALQLIFEGEKSIAEIAKCVKVSRTALYKWMCDNDFKTEMECLRAENDRQTRRKICAMVRKALDRQERIIKYSKNDNAAAVVCKDILDRAGFSAESIIKIDGAEPVQIINNIPRPKED